MNPTEIKIAIKEAIRETLYDSKKLERAYHRTEAMKAVGLKSNLTFDKYIAEGVIPRGHLIGKIRVWYESDLIIAQENIRRGLATPSQKDLEAKRKDYQARAQKQRKTRRQNASHKMSGARS